MLGDGGLKRGDVESAEKFFAGGRIGLGYIVIERVRLRRSLDSIALQPIFLTAASRGRLVSRLSSGKKRSNTITIDSKSWWVRIVAMLLDAQSLH
jgi:hypothetical protein